MNHFQKSWKHSKIFGIISKEVGKIPNNLELDLNHFQKNWNHFQKNRNHCQKSWKKSKIFETKTHPLIHFDNSSHFVTNLMSLTEIFHILSFTLVVKDLNFLSLVFGIFRNTKFEFLKSYSRLDHDSPHNVTCGSLKSYLMYPPGDFSSDAQFFVFTGVVSFLGTMASLVVYIFFSEMYLSEQKRAPMFVSIRFSDFYPRQIMFHMHGNAHLSSTL